MASAGGGEPGVAGGVGARSAPSPRPPCAASRRAVAAYGDGDGDGDGGDLPEVFERLHADVHVDLVSAARCVGASSSPPPPRCAASPLALLPLHGHGVGELRVSLREVFEWLVDSGYVESVASRVGASSSSRLPRPRRAASPPALLPTHGHGGGGLRLRVSLREVFEWLVANGVEPVASCVGASSSSRPPRCAAYPPALLPSDGHGGGDLRLRVSLREVFEWLVVNGYGYVGVASAASGVAAGWPTLPPQCAAPPSAVDASGGHGGGDLRDPLRDFLERLVAEGYVHLASPAFLCPFRSCTINIGRLASYLMNLNAQHSNMLLINQKNTTEAYYPQGQSVFHQHHPRIQELNVDGTNFNVYEEADDLSDALALFIAKPKLFAQPSLLLPEIGLKSQIYATTDVMSAIREFDHATNPQFIDSCTSAPQFCLTAANMSRGSQFGLLHHEHGTSTDRWMTHEVLTCRQCEISAATIQYLFHWNSILEQKLEELSQHNIAAVQDRSISAHDIGPLKAEAVHDSVRNLKEGENVREKSKKETSGGNAPEPDSAPNSDTGSAGVFQEEKLMEKFNKMLVDCVFFAMPQVLIFFPRYQVSEEKSDQRLSLMAIIQHTNNQSNEKVAVVLFFVIFVSVWLLGLVLSLFGHGRRCTAAVSMLTLWTVGSTVAFIDYMLCKCLPEDNLFTWLFWGHWAAMFVGIAYIWFAYVGVPKFPSVRLPRCQPISVRVPKLPPVQFPSCQRVFNLFRGWRHSLAPAVVHDAQAEDELQRALLPV
ncbi:uncharacterized protein [Lolium perenne]|uniref:uncharacterized protein n=1 Tax=Lolium perenne TaxID=4522 RepID=UPI0021F5F16D|nr:uncharacterized protein LOC127298014 [Lolium perenne]